MGWHWHAWKKLPYTSNVTFDEVEKDTLNVETEPEKRPFF